LLKAGGRGGRRDEVEHTPAEPSAPDQPVRLGVVNPLSVAAALVFVSIGASFWWVKPDAPSARPTPEVAAAALDLERVDGRRMCAAQGLGEIREQALRGPSSGERPRLAEYLPEKSPLPGYGKAGARLLDPAIDEEYVSGAVEGHVASFRPEGEGGFDVYAYRFLTRKAAADAIAHHVEGLVCDLDAVPLAARGRPGLLVVEERRPGGWSSAWWMTNTDVVVVKYGGWGDAGESLENLAAIAGAAALY
jgi:hypothetical protein